MKTRCVVKAITLAIVLTSTVVSAQQQFVASMSARDLEGLRAVLDQRLTVVKAARGKARSYIVSTDNPKELLPPEGNDDWQALKLSKVTAQVSAPHASVAMASFTLTHPLDAEAVATMKAALKENLAGWDQTERDAAVRMVADRAVTGLGFAMLARLDGRWKIVSMTVPKL